LPILPEGSAIPESLVAKINRAKLAPVEELCAEGLVPSAEVLAVLCPTVVASVLSKGITDRSLAPFMGQYIPLSRLDDLYYFLIWKNKLELMSFLGTLSFFILPLFTNFINIGLKS